VSKPGVAACKGKMIITSSVAVRSGIALKNPNLESGIKNLRIEKAVSCEQRAKSSKTAAINLFFIQAPF
jgi:hypothetical protein